MEDKYKLCTGHCGGVYENTEEHFYKRDGKLYDKCKGCHIDIVKCNTHGITLEELQSKDAVTHCEICQARLERGSGSNGRTMDHNHTTGEMRGVLCNSCNRGIGLLQDNPWVLEQALAYLDKYGSYVDSENFQNDYYEEQE